MPPKRRKYKKTKKSNKMRLLHLVIIIIILAASWFFDSQYHIVSQLFDTPSVRGENELIMHFVDVGQADCIILELPDGKNMIIDGGTQQAEDKVLNYINSLNITVFDYLMLTHTDADHVGGLDGVVLNTEVKKMYIPDVTREVVTTIVYDNFLTAAENEGAEILHSETSMKITSEVGYEIIFFTPDIEVYDKVSSDRNTISPIIVLYYNDRRVMFTGDATTKSEQYFIEVIQSHAELRYKNTDVDILKVAHHGSRDSTTADFLEAVRPETSVICVGEDNSYGHPHLEALDRITQYSDKIMRTDLCGDIRISLVPTESGVADIIYNTEKQPPQDNLSVKTLGISLMYILYRQGGILGIL